VGFEGGQMPIQRRLPKRGFRSMTRKRVAEIRLNELDKLGESEVDLALLISAGLVSRGIIKAKVIASGKLERAVTLRGVAVTKGARAAIEQAGGTVEL
jgi:large subunit ribosomal protein L15